MLFKKLVGIDVILSHEGALQFYLLMAAKGKLDDKTNIYFQKKT